jgi:hypothetical protein
MRLVYYQFTARRMAKIAFHSPSISLEFLLERMDYCIIIIKLNTSLVFSTLL